VTDRNRLYLLFLQIFIFQAGFGLVVPVLPLYAQEFGIGPAGIGVVIGIYGLARVLADLPAAWLATRIGHSRAMGIGALVLTVGSGLTGFANSLPELLAYRFIAGAGAATTLVVGQAMAAAHPAPFTRSKAISYYQSAFLAGVGLGPVLGGPLADVAGLQAPFLIYAALAAVVGVIGLLAGMPEPVHGSSGHGSPHPAARTYLLLLRDTPFLLVSLITLMMHFTRTGGLHGMVPILGTEQYAMSTSTIGLALGLNGLLNLVVTFAAGSIAERIDRKALLIPGALMLVGSLVVFAMASDPSLFLVAAGLWGVGTGLTGPVTAIYVAERASGDPTPSLGLYRMLSDIGYLTGPLLMGLSATHVGTPVTFLWCAALLLAVVLAFQIVVSSHRKADDQQVAPTASEGTDMTTTPHIAGPLNVEVAGPVGAPVMVFVHPNPLDSASWLFQMAHFSTWYRCVAVDLPGYGRSPSASSGITMAELADAVWEAVDRADGAPTSPAVVVGCSIGSHVAEHMYHRRPEQTRALVLSGTGWFPTRDFAPRRIAEYEQHGVEFRYQHALQDFSPQFAATPLARWLATLGQERNDTADAPSIVNMFAARIEPDPDWLFDDLQAPVLILSGSEDGSHASAFDLLERLPSAEMRVLQGAGHACYFEQPWSFDTEVLAFLARLDATAAPTHLTPRTTLDPLIPEGAS
jgi:predicted MFS family arabinose efflux permease/pimeloyl-ACP methyl ester carboxylesterase